MLTLAVLAAALIAFGAFVGRAYRKSWQWTGLPAAPATSGGAEDRPAKTLWDWLQLLGIPVALAALAFLLNEAQSSRDQRREDQRATQQRRTTTDAERESTLRTYLAQMSDLMLDRQLLRSKPGADVRNVARTATLTAVRRLDGPRRGLVVRFLAEARLLRQKHETARVLLFSADLAYADLRGANLRDVNLRGANLRHAHLSRATLWATDLRGARLFGADLLVADLRDANLIGADLRGANLSTAILRRADLFVANLSGANLRHADLRGANLRYASLEGADLSGTDLRGARGVALTGSRGKPGYGP